MKDINAIYNECMNELKAIGIYAPIATVSINTRAKSRWGQTKRRDGKYSINLASVLLEDKTPIHACKSTMFHEILHTLPNCMNHGSAWQSYADKVNKAYGYNISRTSASDEGDKEGVTLERKAPIYHYTLTCNDCNREWKYQRDCGYTKAFRANKNALTCPICKTSNFSMIHY